VWGNLGCLFANKLSKTKGQNESGTFGEGNGKAVSRQRVRSPQTFPCWPITKEKSIKSVRRLSPIILYKADSIHKNALDNPDYILFSRLWA